MRIPGRRATPVPKLTPVAGVSTMQSEAMRLAQVVSQAGGGIANARKAVIAMQELLRDRANFPNVGNELIARAVHLYHETNYVRDRLKGMITTEELQLIEGTVNDFLSLVSSPDRLPIEVRETTDRDIPFARFYAGLFALARGESETALSHFSRAGVVTKEERYDTWEIEPEKLSELAAHPELLGQNFLRLKELLPAVAAPVEEHHRALTAVIDLAKLPDLPGNATYHLGRSELTDAREATPAPRPPASPDTSAPRTRPGSRSPQK